METGRVALDSNGMPVLLADVAPSGVSKIDSNATSGNPRHDTRSGKFGAGGVKEEEAPPPNTDPLEFKRMLDAVRDASREFDDPDIGDIKEFLSGRAKAPDQVDVGNFLMMVQEQRKADAVDLLDQNLRTTGVNPQGRRKVRVVAPRGFVRKMIGSMDQNMLAEVMHRLEARGHDRKDIDDYFKGRVGDDTHAAGTKQRDTLK